MAEPRAAAERRVLKTFQEIIKSHDSAEVYEVWVLLTSYVGGRLRKSRGELTQMVIDSTNPEDKT